MKESDNSIQSATVEQNIMRSHDVVLVRGPNGTVLTDGDSIYHADTSDGEHYLPLNFSDVSTDLTSKQR